MVVSAAKLGGLDLRPADWGCRSRLVQAKASQVYRVHRSFSKCFATGRPRPGEVRLGDGIGQSEQGPNFSANANNSRKASGARVHETEQARSLLRP